MSAVLLSAVKENLNQRDLAFSLIWLERRLKNAWNAVSSQRRGCASAY